MSTHQDKLITAYDNWKHTMETDVPAYLESLTEQEKEAEKLARELLGTSYFIERTHGFLKWKAAQGKK
jgi:hypothetical protein